MGQALGTGLNTSSLSHTQKQTEGREADGHNDEECVQSGLSQLKPQPLTHTGVEFYV